MDIITFLYQQYFNCATFYNSNNPIPPVIQLLVALRFYATGCFLITIADFYGISEASTQRIVHRVLPTIAALRNQFIKLPV